MVLVMWALGSVRAKYCQPFESLSRASHEDDEYCLVTLTSLRVQLLQAKEGHRRRHGY